MYVFVGMMIELFWIANWYFDAILIVISSRDDLVCKGGFGLVIELCMWSWNLFQFIKVLLNELRV